MNPPLMAVQNMTSTAAAVQGKGQSDDPLRTPIPLSGQSGQNMVGHIGPLPGLQLTEPSEGQFGCEICGKSFKSNKSLATHKGHHVRREEMPSMKSVKSRTSSGSAHSIKTKVESTNIDPVSMGGAIASQPTVIELPRIIPMPSYPLRTHSVPQPQPVGFGMMLNQN